MTPRKLDRLDIPWIDWQYSFAPALANARGVTLSDSVDLSNRASAEANPPPVAMLPRPTSATSGDSISLSAPGSSDPDGDALTYAWSYPASVTAEAHEEHLTARLPKVTADTSLVFTVKVSHGKATTTASQTVVVRASSTYPPYREGTKYNGGEIVSDAGTLYRCKPFPQSGCCGQAAWTYEPGRRTNWQDAWVVY